MLFGNIGIFIGLSFQILVCFGLNNTAVPTRKNNVTASTIIIITTPTTTVATTTATTTTTTAKTTTATTTTDTTTTTTTTLSPPVVKTYVLKTSNPVTFLCNLHDLNDVLGISLVRNEKEIFFNVSINKSGVSNYSKTLFDVLGSNNEISIVYKSVQFHDQGNYTCVIKTKTYGDIKDNRYNIFVEGKLEVYLNTTFRELDVFDTDSLFILCSFNGRPVYDFSWDKGMVENVAADKLLLKFEPKKMKVRKTSYSCTASNLFGNTTVAVVVNVLASKPSVPVIKGGEIKDRSLTLSWSVTLSGKGDINKFILNGKDLTHQEYEYQVSQLLPNTSYVYELKACNLFGCSGTGIVKLTTLKQERIGSPTNLTLSNITASSVVVNFNHGMRASEPSTRNLSVSVICLTPHKKCIKDDGMCQKVSYSRTSAMIERLMAFRNYTVCIYTCESVYNTCSSPVPIHFQTKVKLAGKAEDVAVTNTDQVFNIQLRVNWKQPKKSNAPYLNYQISYTKSIHEEPTTVFTNIITYGDNVATPFEVVIGEMKESFSYTITNLDGNTLYFVRVDTVNSAGLTKGDYLKIVTDESVPSVPNYVRAEQKSYNKLDIEWDPPVSSAPISSYAVRYSEINQPGIVKQIFVIGKTYARLSNLQQLKTYKVSVYARLNRKRDSMLLEGPPYTTTFTTLEYIPPVEDTNTTLIAVAVVCLLMVLIVIIISIYCCRKYGFCFTLDKTSKFYIDEPKDHRAISISLKQSLKNIDTKRTPMSLEKFERHVTDLHSNSDYLFSEEYASLGPHRPDTTCFHSKANENKAKNRYGNIVAYDQTRVRLFSIDGVPGSNYINANFINGYHKPMAYIGTQAPLANTIPDFWRMIWENETRVIVMLTNLVEHNGKRKCDQYWPTEGKTNYKGMVVSLVSQQKYANYIIRQFLLKKVSCQQPTGALESPGEPRTIWQYHFTEWPDFGVPKDRLSILSFVVRTREHETEEDGPSIIHCSAGVGRTGTFIVIDSQMRRIDQRQDVEIYEFLKGIRLKRNYLVQQECQYIFIHDTIMDYLKVGPTRIANLDLEIVLNQEYWRTDDGSPTVVSKQWKYLQEMKVPVYQQPVGQRPCNQPKNRLQSILPADPYRVRLPKKVMIEGSDYINASFVDSFLKKAAYIITQYPLHNTRTDFWRMVWEWNTRVIVSLATFEELDMVEFSQCIPTLLFESIKIGKFQIKIIEEQAYNNYTKRKLEVKNNESSATDKSIEIIYYNFYNWTEDFFPRMAFLFELVTDVTSTYKHLQDNKKIQKRNISPILIKCKNGIGRSGILCALLNLKEQLEDSWQMLDLFSTTQILRLQRPNIIHSEEQYDYLYKALVSLKHYLVNNKCS